MSRIHIKRSYIQGLGVFASDFIPEGTNLGKVTDPYPKITSLGRRINHSFNANAILVYKSSHHKLAYHELTTLRDIQKGEEITLNYEICPGFQPPEIGWL